MHDDDGSRMPTILIAEDDHLISSFIEKGLRAEGYATRVVDDGAQAERLGLTDEFDLLILDMALPERSGFQVLETLREQAKHTPILVLTGRPELKDLMSHVGVGSENFMTKPFRFEDLLDRVRALLPPGGSARATDDAPRRREA